MQVTLFDAILPIRSLRRANPRLKLPLYVLLALCASGSALAASGTTDRLQDLAQRMTFEWAKLHPITATYIGLSDEDGRLDTPSEAENASDLAKIRGWENELSAIPLEGASLVDVDDAKLLRAQLIGMERNYTVYKTYEKDPSGPALSIVGAIYMQFLHLPIAGTAGATPADAANAWRKIVQRLAGAPAYIAAGNALVTRPGHLYGVIGAEQLAAAPGFFNGPLTDAARDQLPANDFANFTRARDATVEAMERTKKNIDDHVASWPENYAIGRDAYNAMLRDELLLPFSGDDIERMGREELDHGWTVALWVEHLAAERNTPIGPESGGGLAPGGPALIEYYRSKIAHLQDFVNQHHVVDVPGWLGEIKVIETPKFLQPVSPGASMFPPLLFSKSGTGFYFITPPTSLAEAAKNLDPNEDFDSDRILSTAAHEAMPGHFLQLSIARRHPTSFAGSRAAAPSPKAGHSTEKSSSCSSDSSALTSTGAITRRSGNACEALARWWIQTSQAVHGVSIRQFSFSPTRLDSARNRRKQL